jgi:hypothetical protein
VPLDRIRIEVNYASGTVTIQVVYPVAVRGDTDKDTSERNDFDDE